MERVEEGSLRSKAISGVLWTLTQQFGNQGVQFIVSIILARVLMPAEFGLIGMIVVFYAIGTTLASAGLTQSLIRGNNLSQSDYSTVFFFNLIGSSVIYSIMYIAAPYIAGFYNQPSLVDITRVYCLSFVINALSAVQMTRLTKEMKFKSQTLISLPSIIISAVLGVWMAYQGYGVWSLVWMSLSQSLLNTIQLWIYGKWTPSWVFDFSKFKSHFGFGYKLMLSSLIDSIFSNIYQILIGKFFVASQLGFYTRANTLKQLPIVNLSRALDKVTYPLFASIQNNDLRLKSAYKQLMQMVLFSIVPVLIIMNVMAEPLFRFLFTEKWLPAVPYFKIIAITGLLYPIHAYNLNILKVKGRSDLFLYLEIVKKVMVVIMILITFRFGIIGLLWGQLLNSVIAFFINTYYTGKYLKYTSLQQTKDLLPIFILGFVMGSVVWAADQFMLSQQWSDLMRLMMSGFIGLGAYLSLAWFFKMDAWVSFSKLILKK